MNRERPPRVLCFGEVLWDCLPTGRLPGGAPFNVAWHLAQLGGQPVMISAVGADALGDEMLTYLSSHGLNTEFIARHRRLPTGVVTVALSSRGQPSYTIEEGVAWDDLAGMGQWRAAIPGSEAVVFGSLAARTMENRAVLDELLAANSLLRVMDVNLRAPYDDRERVLDLARQADWLKLNEHELEILTGSSPAENAWPENLLPSIEALANATGCRHICVTCGERGAVWWDNGASLSATSPPVVVRDSIGAGDAFTAAIVHGLLTMPKQPETILQRACDLGALVASLPGGQPQYDVASIERRRG